MKKYNSMEIKDVNNISVIMFGLLGDVLIRTPILRALKKIYPSVRVTAFVDEIGAAVLNNNPYCDEIVVVNRTKKNRVKYIINKMKSMFILRQKKFDMIVDLYNGGSSHGMVSLSGIKYKLGLCNSKKKSIYNIECVNNSLQIQSFYKNYIDIIKPLSKEVFDLKPVFEVTKRNTLDINLENKYLLNFGSGGLEKIMSFEKYFFLVKYIYEKYNFSPAVILNPGQEFLQEDFIKDFLIDSGIDYIKLPSLNLNEVTGLMGDTKFIITLDTGLMHLAMSQNSYIYVLFTYTNPILVDLRDEKFFSVFEGFREDELHKEQNITQETLITSIDAMFYKIKTAV